MKTIVSFVFFCLIVNTLSAQQLLKFGTVAESPKKLTLFETTSVILVCNPQDFIAELKNPDYFKNKKKIDIEQLVANMNTALSARDSIVFWSVPLYQAHTSFIDIYTNMLRNQQIAVYSRKDDAYAQNGFISIEDKKEKGTKFIQVGFSLDGKKDFLQNYIYNNTGFVR